MKPIPVLLAAAGVAAALPLTAQTAPAATPAAPRPGETVELSPFTVTADQDVGYLAANTLAGSRLNTPLKDTAASISVFTREFLDDLGAFDITEALVFGNNVQLNRDDQGTFGDAPNGNAQLEFNQRYRVRGVDAQVARNYFKWENPTDTYNVGRIEDSRGPNSVLFGLGSAGGVINVATKQAELRRTLREVTLAVDEYGSRRAALDLNQPLGDRGAVRVNALWNDAKFRQHHSFSESRRLHLAAKYRFNPRWQVRAEYETGRVEENRGRNSGTFDFLLPWISAGRPTFALTAPNAAFAGLGSRLGANQFRYVSNLGRVINLQGQLVTAGANAPILDRAIADDSINSGGPGQVRGNPFSAYAVFLEGELRRKTFVEFAFNHQEYDFESFDPQNSHRLFADANTTLPGTLGANPNVGGLFMETQWRRFDRAESSDTLRGTVSTELDAGRWGRYRVAVLGEYEEREFTNASFFELWNGAPFNATAEAGANQVIRRTYVRPGDWGSYFVEGPRRAGHVVSMTDPVSGRTLTSSFYAPQAANDDPAEQWSVLGGLQASWFGGRLNVGAGYRHDHVSIHDRAQKRNPATGAIEVDYDTVAEVKADGKTYSAGVVWHATPRLSLLYNEAKNLSLPNSGIRVLPRAAIATPPEGAGQDYGVGVELLEGRLYARAVRFTTSVKGEVGFGGAPHQNSSNAILDGLRSANLISQSDYDARRLDGLNGQRRDKDTEGYELTLTANPTKNWRLSVNYSRTEGTEDNIIPEVVAWWTEAKAYYQRFPQNTPTGIGVDTLATEIQEEDDRISDAKSVEGFGLIGNRKHKANFFTRYTFAEGFLKGLYLGGGYRYQGRMLTGRAGDGVTLQYAPAYGEANLLAGYSLRFKDRRRLNVQINVSNLFDETDPIISRYFTSGDLKRARRILIREPRSVRVTTTVAF